MFFVGTIFLNKCNRSAKNDYSSDFEKVEGGDWAHITFACSFVFVHSFVLSSHIW